MERKLLLQIYSVQIYWRLYGAHKYTHEELTIKLSILSAIIVKAIPDAQAIVTTV